MLLGMATTWCLSALNDVCANKHYRKQNNGPDRMTKKATKAKEMETVKAALPARAYEPTEADLEGVWKYHERLKEKPPAPRFKVTETERGAVIENAHPDPSVGGRTLMAQLGTSSPDFLDGIIKQTVAGYAGGKVPSTEDVNFLIGALRGIEPRDEVEAMLAAQMVAVHNATMKVAEQFSRVENLMQFEAQEKAYNKLARTFTTQVETLKRYRTNGEQKVTVQHVHVSDGGQAVIGHVSTGEGGGKRKRRATP